MISIIDSRYVVQLPEYGVYQDIDPKTGRPFADEAAAKAWADAFTATIAEHKAAEAEAEQAKLAVTLHVDVVPTHAEIALGGAVTLSATIRNGLDQVMPLDDAFNVPIENEHGEVVLIKRVSFKSGIATVEFSPTRSGYYCITEIGINRRLPESMYLRLPEAVEVVVYE